MKKLAFVSWRVLSKNISVNCPGVQKLKQQLLSNILIDFILKKKLSPKQKFKN